MTNEMAEVLTRQYNDVQKLYSDSFDKWDETTMKKSLIMQVTIDRIVAEFGLEFKETFDGNWILCKR